MCCVTAVKRLSRASVTTENLSGSGIEGHCHVCHAIVRFTLVQKTCLYQILVNLLSV